jgi:hypothetical protein
MPFEVSLVFVIQSRQCIGVKHADCASESGDGASLGCVLLAPQKSAVEVISQSGKAVRVALLVSPPLVLLRLYVLLLRDNRI